MDACMAPCGAQSAGIRTVSSERRCGSGADAGNVRQGDSRSAARNSARAATESPSDWNALASIMAQQDFWADTFKMVERKVPQDRVVDTSIAKEAVQRLAAEKPFG